MSALKERVKWRSRRGLLELDIFFTRYYAKHLDALSDAELETLLDMLTTDDIELWKWVGGREECPVEEWKSLIAAIRQA
ncbi:MULTISPECIES: succinate dehydrogenase assembly factor 2 [Niveibacterium]|uniref:FAD assembly factor SdhE n=1 Tax=Niveibacterium microcysteis TaxID=2811415 RepID=A0ABX7MC22_9RHOO|nr:MULTISPECIES: succinate dehydrogenase assembly factor 2 [Niveibacterium]QSI78944.1 succinate dehydrogenase assembly factor 2 [Niveibacterium microcysteis]